MTKKEIIISSLAVIAIFIILAFLRLTNRIDDAQVIQLLITFALVCVTLAYVKRTADIARATKEQAEIIKKQTKSIQQQAEASVIMAEGTKKPYILLRLDITDGDVLELKTKFPPEELRISALNAGSGPAINLEAFFWGKKYQSASTNKGYLAQNEQWKTSIIGLDIIPTNISWIPDLVKSELIKKNITYAIIVGYEDINNRKLASYLAIEFIEDKFMFDGKQSIVELKND